MSHLKLSSLQTISNYKHKHLIFNTLKSRINCEYQIENITKNKNIFEISVLLNNCGRITRKVFIINIVDSEVYNNSPEKKISTYSADPTILIEPTITTAVINGGEVVITGTNFLSGNNTYVLINANQYYKDNWHPFSTTVIGVLIPSVYGFMTVNVVNISTDKLMISNQKIVSRESPKDSPTITSIDNSTIDSSTQFNIVLMGTNLSKIKTVILAMVLNTEIDGMIHTGQIRLSSLTFDPITGIATFDKYSPALLKTVGSFGPFNVVLNTDTNIEIGIDPSVASVTLTNPITPPPEPTPPVSSQIFNRGKF